MHGTAQERQQRRLLTQEDGYCKGRVGVAVVKAPSPYASSLSMARAPIEPLSSFFFLLKLAFFEKITQP